MTEGESPEQIYERRGNDYLRDQLEYLRKHPKLKRKFTLLAVECRRCHSVVLEVIATRPYWVVLKRSTDSSEPTPPGLYERPSGLTGMEWGRLINQRRREAKQDNPIRQSPEPGFIPISREPEPTDLDGTRKLVAVCRCAQFERRMLWLHEQLASAPKNGRTHVVAVSPPDFAR